MSAAVKRACDACHRRKVKCDGINPCRNCSSAQLACTYNAIPQKKGPKGSRAKVISELRENQRQSNLTAKYHNRINGVPASASAGYDPTPGLLTNELIKTCLDFYFAHMYSKIPILNRQRIEQDAMVMDSMTDTYCLLTSLCAFMMLQPGIAIPRVDHFGGTEALPGATIATASKLLDETLRVRRSIDYFQTPTVYSIATDYFLFAYYYGLDMQDKAWCCLREATTLVYLIHMNCEESYMAWDNTDASCRRRLYWLLFVAERAYALRYGRPLSLKATINAPTPTDDPSDPLGHELATFCRQVDLFRPFDASFVDLWDKARGAYPATYFATLEKQHNDAVAALSGADPQLADVMRNQQWLQALAWQINVASGTTIANGTTATYQYPLMDLAREIAPMARSLASQDTTDFINNGLMKTFLAITSNLMDVLSMMPSSSNPFTTNPRDDRNRLAGILAMLRIGEHHFTPLLLAKVHDILPRLANPMLLASPEMAQEVDIFDGFGNAGMAQPPGLVIDDYKPDMTSVDGTSLPDASASFVSSPPLIPSVSMDFARSMAAEFSPIPDMVMNHPLGNSVSTIPAGIAPNSQQQTGLSHVQLKLPMQASRLPQIQQSQHIQKQHALHRQQPPPLPHQQQRVPPTQPVSCSPNASAQLRRNLASSATLNMPGQIVDQHHGMPAILGNPGFGNSMNSTMGSSGLSTAKGLAPQQQSQRQDSFSIAPQQIRPASDFQSVQRVNSDLNSLGSLGLNGGGPEVDFSAL